MASFPTSADFNRPTPQAGGAVPRGGPQRGSPGGAPIPNDPTRIATYDVPKAADPSSIPAQVMLDQARQSGELAVALDRFGAIADKFALTLDETAAQDALNKLRAKRQELTYDPEKGYQRFKGGAINKPGPGGGPLTEELPGHLTTAADELGGELSVRARKMFAQAAAREVLGYRRDVAVHLANESEKYETAVYKDTQLTNLSEAVTVSGDPLKLKEVADRAALAADIRARQTGMPSQAKQMRSNVLRAAIEGQIANGNGPQALAMYRALLPDLDGQDRVALAPTMKTVGIGEVAKLQARSLTDPTYDGRTRSYESGAMEYNKLGSGAFGPYQFMPATWSDVRAKNPDLNLPADMTKATREQHDAAHTAFKTGNAQALQAAGFDASPANLYLAHRFGSGGAVAVLRAPADTSLADVLPADWQRQNPDMKGQTTGSFRALAERRYAGVTQTGVRADPLLSAVNSATGTGAAAPKDGPLYRDTRQMLLDADIAYDTATRRNAEINANNDDQRRATQSQLDLNLAGQKRQIEMAKLNLEIGVDKWMTTGGKPDAQGNATPATSRPPPEIWNQLPYTKQQSIDATIAHNLRGTDAVTDDQVWAGIHRMLTSEDPAVRANAALISLWEYKPKLSRSDFQELSRLQGQLRTGDPNKELTHVRSAAAIIDDTLQKLGINPGASAGRGDATKADSFRRIATSAINRLETEQKRKSTPEEQQKIVDRTAMDIFLKKGTLWGEVTKPRYELTIADVPAKDRAQIIEVLKAEGIPVTDDWIIELYARGNARPSGGTPQPAAPVRRSVPSPYGNGDWLPEWHRRNRGGAPAVVPPT